MRKTTSKIIALLLVALTVFSMALTAGAVKFEGETSDGSWGSGGGTGGEDVDHKYTYFEVLSTTSSQNIVAYRFSYVKGGDKANVLKESSKDDQDCLEIWIDSDESHNGRIGYSAFAFDDDTNTGFRVEYKSGADGIPVESMFPKLSKRQYVLGEHKGVQMQTVVRTLAGTGCDGSVRYDDKDYFDLDGDGESDLSGKLTNDHTKLKAWCTDDTNAEVIAKCLGQEDGIAGMALGDKIVVEPVFLHGIEVGGKPVWVAMTVTEIAAMATGYYKLPFEDYAAYGAGDAYAIIGLFSNGLWPKTVYTPKGMGLWNDAPLNKYKWPYTSSSTGKYVWVSERFRTWEEMMYDGLGVAIVYNIGAEENSGVVAGGDEYDVAATDIRFYSDPDCTQEIEFNRGQTVTFGQRVYTTMTYANYSTRDVYIDAFYDVDYLKLPTDSGFGYQLSAGNALTVSGGFTDVDFIGRGSLTTRTRIAVSAGNPYLQYPGDANADDINERFLNLYAEVDSNGNVINLHEVNATNNVHTEDMFVTYDVEITNIILSTAARREDITPENTYAELLEDGSTITYGALPYGEVIYVYHTYRNNALADMNCTGYNSAGNPVVHDGKTIYSLPAGQEVTILAENFVADNSNATQEIEGSIYWHEDTEKEMVYESDRTNNIARISAGTQYDLAIHDIILSKAGSWPQVNDSNIIARLDANGNTVTTDGARILVDDIVYVYHTYTSDTPTDMSVNTYQNGALVGDAFEIRADDGQVTKLVGKLDTSKAGDFSMSGAIYRRGRNNPAGESNTENNLLSIDYTVISYDVALTDIYLYSDANYTTKIDPTKLTYGQTVYVGYAYTNNGSIPVQVDGYNANNTLIANTAIGLGLGVGETKVVRGGSLEVNWIGNSALDGTVRIVQDSNEEPYENLNREPTDGTRLLPLRTELDAENRKGNLGNNYKSITLTAYYDVGITKITLRNGIGEILNPLNIPFGEKIYVYHTYHNYSSGPLNVTGYKSDDTAVLHNGSTVYSIPAGGDIEVLAETYTADTNNMSRKLIGSIYKSDDTAKEMTWETDKNNNRMEVVATTEYDLAITNILLMNGSGKIIGQLDKDGNVVTPSGAPLEVYRGEKVLIYHTYTSDTPGTIDASGYVNDKVFLPNGTGSYFTLGGNLTDNTVCVGVLDTSEIGEFTMKGSVYYKHTKSADKESNPHNNVAYITYTVVEGLPWLEAIEPNQAYREGTEVITSFLVHNDTSVIFTPDVGLKVRMWVLDADTRQPVPGEDGKPIVLTQSVSMPANETQLIYYRWTVPTLNNQSKRFLICADFTITSRLNGEWVGEIAENFYRYKSWEITFTPDTQYEADKPDYWARPSVGDYENASSEWSRWEYINGSFRKVNYGVVFQPGVVSVIPTSKTAYKDTVTGNWNMKSGYGFTIDAANVAVLRLPDCVMPDPEAYTVEQYGYALFPEFEYEEEYQQMCGTATLEPKESGGFHLYEFVVADKNGDDKSYGRVHWTPIWYPDGKYFVKVIQQDIWTPAGAVEVVTISNRIDIKDNMYSDWYIGHG